MVSMRGEKEIRKLKKSAVYKVDPEAFANVLKTERVIGRFYQRPAE